MSAKKRWDSIDFIKGLACIAVVLIHFNFPGNLGILVKAACRFGVPVFFFVSGFFLGWIPAEEMDVNKLVRKIRHILLLMCGAAIFYICFTIWYRYMTQEAESLVAYATEVMTAGKLVKFFVQNDPFVYGHLWFLSALIYCYLFVLFVPIKRKWIPGVFGILLMLGFLALTIYHPWIPIRRYIPVPETETVISVFNLFFFRAFGFFLMGMFCKIHTDKISEFKLDVKVWILLALFGCSFGAFERFMLGESQFYIGSYVTFFALIFWAIQNPSRGGGGASLILVVN